jgi:hypothetical protein
VRYFLHAAAAASSSARLGPSFITHYLLHITGARRARRARRMEAWRPWATALCCCWPPVVRLVPEATTTAPVARAAAGRGTMQHVSGWQQPPNKHRGSGSLSSPVPSSPSSPARPPCCLCALASRRRRTASRQPDARQHQDALRFNTMQRTLPYIHTCRQAARARRPSRACTAQQVLAAQPRQTARLPPQTATLPGVQQPSTHASLGQRPSQSSARLPSLHAAHLRRFDARTDPSEDLATSAPSGCALNSSGLMFALFLH